MSTQEKGVGMKLYDYVLGVITGMLFTAFVVIVLASCNWLGWVSRWPYWVHLLWR
jgi:hypothetical protein